MICNIYIFISYISNKLEIFSIDKTKRLKKRKNGIDRFYIRGCKH